MAINLLNKLRTELYKVSEFEELEKDDTSHDLQKDNTAILNFLSIARSLRNKSDYEIIESFSKTLCCDNVIIIKSLFYIRDIKFGLGERQVFRVIINYLANNHPELILEHLQLIHKYGRWDDYYALFNTTLEKDVIKIFKIQLSYDLTSKKPSQLAKWLKSENTSSKISRKLGTRTRVLMGYTSQEYRIILSKLRKRLNIIERLISSSEYNLIDYSKVQLSTCLKYKNSLICNDKERFLKYLKDYKNSINEFSKSYNLTNVSNSPFNIIDTMVKMNNNGNIIPSNLHDDLWSSFCNEYSSLFEDTYVIISISKESKINRTLSYKAAISIILFFNKFNTNIYKDYYMYFNPKPHFGKIENRGVVHKVNLLKNIEFETNHNVESALDLLLFTSIKKELSNGEIPKNIMVISDWEMEKKYKNNNNVQLIKNKWGLSGYVMPKLKFWNIQGGDEAHNVSKDIYSNIFASGYSLEVFISILKGEVSCSDELLMKKLLGRRYEDIM